MTRSPPEGFVPHDRSSPLTEPWEPIYSRIDGSLLRMGLFTDRSHTNSRGLVHGGLIAALADNAMGLGCRLAGGGPDLVTVSLAVDYLAPAQRGEWLEIQPVVLRIGRLLSFATALVVCGGEPCAQTRGTYRTIVPTRRGEERSSTGADG